MLFSTEYLDLSTYQDGWKEGPNLENGIRKVPMLEDPATGSVYLVGAKRGFDFSIYRLNSVDSDWTALTYKPKLMREGHVALFLPTKLVNSCSTFVHSEL